VSSHDEFFNSKQAEAVFKHGILKRYPVVFASKTGVGNPVVFLDGYAGRGEYKDGSPGSPLLLSRAAEFLHGRRDVVGYFVEQDDENFANLERVLRDKGGPTKFEVRHGSVDQHLPELLRLSDGASLFAFLDPFGPALDFNLIKEKLLARSKWPPTEVLLHFSVLSVARMGRAVHAARQAHSTLSDDDGKTAARLDRFLDGSWWKDYFAQVHDEADEKKATDVAMQVFTEYQSRLWTAAWFTERLNKEGPSGQGSLFGELPGFDDNQYERDNRDAWTKAIAANIDALLTRIGPSKLADRVPEVYGTVLGQAWERHARAAIKLLHSSLKVDHDGRGDFWKDTLRRP
jgi:three-Cys-motif partner protein